MPLTEAKADGLEPPNFTRRPLAPGLELDRGQVMSTFTLSRTPKFKLSTTGLLRSCLLDDTSLRPLERADEVGDLTGEVVGRRPAEVRRDHNLAPAAPHPDEPDSPRWAAAVLVEAVVDLDAERA